LSSDLNKPNDVNRGVLLVSFEALVSFFIVAIGLFIFIGSLSIDLGVGYDRVGPRFFPYLVSIGLLISGILLAKSVLKHKGALVESLSFQRRWSGLGTLSISLVLSVLLFNRAGFILTSMLLFWLVARAFESRRYWRDAVVGLLLSISVYLFFTEGLGLVLPGGFLGRFF
jgi:putative tricarboxylic transport membrane protein